MAEYIDPPLEAEPGLKYEEMVAELQTRWPDWTPADANLEVQILLAVANLSASDEQTASGALTSIFRWFGQNLVPGGQPEEAVAASGTITVVLNENPSGVTIPAGTTYGVDVGEEALLGFEVVLDQIIAPGVLTVAGIPVIAGDEGVVGNDLTGELVQVDSLGFVASVTFDTPTSGGVDAEEDDVYLDRLRALLQLQAPRPIVADDFAIMARSVPGVERATAIDGYDPADHATFNPNDPNTWKERFVTVSVIDADGEDPGATVRTAVDVMFNGSAALGIPARREVNFVVVVAAPTYTLVDVTFTAIAWPTWNPSDVQASAIAAVTEYLQPYLWGQTGFGEARGWENTPTVNIDGLYTVLRSVEGLRNVTSLVFGKTGGGFTDDFSTNTLANYTADVGSTGNFAISGGTLNYTGSSVINGLIRTSGSGTSIFSNPQATAKFHTPPTSLTLNGMGLGVILKRATPASYIRAFITDDGTTSSFVIDKRTGAGTIVPFVSVALASRVSTSTNYWVRARVVGDTITAELWSGGAPEGGGTLAKTLSYTLSGADAVTYGQGATGASGLLVLPRDTSVFVDDFVVTELQGAGPFALDGSPGPVLTRPGTITGTVT